MTRRGSEYCSVFVCLTKSCIFTPDWFFPCICVRLIFPYHWTLSEQWEPTNRNLVLFDSIPENKTLTRTLISIRDRPRHLYFVIHVVAEHQEIGLELIVESPLLLLADGLEVAGVALFPLHSVSPRQDQVILQLHIRHELRPLLLQLLEVDDVGVGELTHSAHEIERLPVDVVVVDVCVYQVTNKLNKTWHLLLPAPTTPGKSDDDSNQERK